MAPKISIDSTFLLEPRYAFLRDQAQKKAFCGEYECAYCGQRGETLELVFDDVRKRDFVVVVCMKCTDNPYASFNKDVRRVMTDISL